MHSDIQRYPGNHPAGIYPCTVITGLRPNVTVTKRLLAACTTTGSPSPCKHVTRRTSWPLVETSLWSSIEQVAHPTDCSTWTNKMVGIEMAINQCCHLVVTNKMLLLGIIILKRLFCFFYKMLCIPVSRLKNRCRSKTAVTTYITHFCEHLLNVKPHLIFCT